MEAEKPQKDAAVSADAESLFPIPKTADGQHPAPGAGAGADESSKGEGENGWAAYWVSSVFLLRLIITKKKGGKS